MRAGRRPASPTGFPVVGMVGGGQLSRMTAQAAIALGGSLRVLAERPDDAAALVVAGVEVGAADDLPALRRFADGCAVVTFDHEHVPPEHIRALEADGHAVHPGSAALLHAQDKAVLRARLEELGVPSPRWARLPAEAAEREAALRAFVDAHGPAVVKATRGGYDGRGVWLPPAGADAPDVDAVPSGTGLLAEQRVPLVRELAVVVARSPFGQVAAFPVVETVQRDGVCVEVLVPAAALDEERALEAEALAVQLADALGVVGLLAVELFETAGGLLVNELAMRPHNSAHWTLGGARTSQFEQHLRAVLDLPLGDPRAVAPAVAMANVFGGDDPDADLFGRLHHAVARDPGAAVHLYGKTSRPGRKIGHVTVTGDDADDVRRRARAAAHHLRTGEDV